MPRQQHRHQCHDNVVNRGDPPEPTAHAYPPRWPLIAPSKAPRDPSSSTNTSAGPRDPLARDEFPLPRRRPWSPHRQLSMGPDPGLHQTARANARWDWSPVTPAPPAFTRRVWSSLAETPCGFRGFRADSLHPAGDPTTPRAVVGDAPLRLGLAQEAKPRPGPQTSRSATRAHGRRPTRVAPGLSRASARKHRSRPSSRSARVVAICCEPEAERPSRGS